MKKNLTEMVFILDRSGSMYGLRSDTVGGFNSLIEKQRLEKGEALVSTVLFNHNSSVLHDRVPLDQVEAMTDTDYIPSGNTALLDAVGNAIKHIRNVHKYARKGDIPEHTVFVITTDGMENASRTFTQSEVKKLIKKQQNKHGWEFIFLGANIDAVETAAHLGISGERSANYKSDKAGTAVMFDAVNCAVNNVRQCAPMTAAWKEEVEADSRR